MTTVKICGIKSLDSALTAARAGAEFLGIVFESHSKRYLDPDSSKVLIDSFKAHWHLDRPLWVGVFANQPLEEVNHILNYCNLDMAQLSGQETPLYCKNVIRPVLKVIHINDDTPTETSVQDADRLLTTYKETCDLLMLDTFKQGILGGTGQQFNWDIGMDLSSRHSLMLAGGLNPENVSQAIRTIRPSGLAVSSGVETNGEKDLSKIASFISVVTQTDNSSEHPYNMQ